MHGKRVGGGSQCVGVGVRGSSQCVGTVGTGMGRGSLCIEAMRTTGMGMGWGSQCIGMAMGGVSVYGDSGEGVGRGRQRVTAPSPPSHPRSRNSGTPRPEQNKGDIEAVGPGGGGGKARWGTKRPLSFCPSVLLCSPKRSVTVGDGGGRGLRVDRWQIRTCPRIPVSVCPGVLLSPCPSVPLSSRRRFAPTSPPCSPYAAAAPPRQGALCFRPHLPEVIPSAPLDGAWDRNEPSGERRRGGVIRVWVGVSSSGAASRQGEASQDVTEE